MGILDTEIVKGFMRMRNDGWLSQGWHVEQRRQPDLPHEGRKKWRSAVPSLTSSPANGLNMGQADNLAGSISSPPVPASAQVLQRRADPVHSIGIVEINDKGDSWRIVWGLRAAQSPHPSSPATL